MLTPEQLTGLDDSHLVPAGDGQRLEAQAAEAFAALREEARAAGFELTVASGYRSFERQLAIWNGKARGERPVHDDAGNPLDLGQLAPRDQLAAILRFSALPGTSRHHWGTDLDVYDAAAVNPDYALELSPREVAPGGVFDPLHRWLDERMAGGLSHGFFRPYARDRGGVAPERWHLSYAPRAGRCAGGLTAALLRDCWNKACPDRGLVLREEIERDLPGLLKRFVRVPEDWCPPALG